MRLRTQFIITMLLFGIILVVIAASAIITNQQVEKTQPAGKDSRYYRPGGQRAELSGQ